MSEEEGYECPHCECQDQMGYIEDARNHMKQWKKEDGVWKKVQPTLNVLAGFYFCPQCGKPLPNDVVLRWSKEPRED